MTVKLLTAQHLKFQSITGGCTGSSESIHVKMPHCQKPYVAAQFYLNKIKHFIFKASQSHCRTFSLISCFNDCAICKID